MSTSTIPYTPTTPGWTPTRPRPLHPTYPHPDLESTEAPALPVPPRPPVFHVTTNAVYRLTTHLVPAGFPRLTPDIPLPDIPTYIPGESRSERRDQMDLFVKQALEMQDAYVGQRLGGKSSERLLWNCVNRYVRTSEQSVVAGSGTPVGVTLFLAHANGFHKETWETMLKALLDGPAGGMVDEVWAWDAVQHGDAAVVNAENQNGIFDWFDNTRDIANFLLHYMPEEVEATALPMRLPRVPASMTEVRVRDGYRMRSLVVVGHSFGGCTSLRVAIDFPKLFSSFVLVDPVIHRPGTPRLWYTEQITLGAFMRRDRWPSRDEALEMFKKSPFFGTWHPAVLELYVDHALIDDSEGGVQLKMPKLQEGLAFANRVPPSEMWELLERLDERIALRWVIPEKPLTTNDWMHEKVWRRPANATNVVFHFAGHLIVQEAPLELARDITDFLQCQHGSAKPRL